ncbi:MAG TPA: endolytic transglycosylase MltG [Bryobacteraceae bacterium]|nr:endolytic transglycosylase MltG [Bryobacteraceae bacterium]
MVKNLTRYALLASAAALLAALAALWSLGTPYSAAPGETFLEIERGSGTASIARTLQQAGVIRYQWQVYAARLMHPSSKLQAGEYRFDRPSSALDVLDRIRRGDIYHFDVSVPEGSNRFDIAKIVERTGTISADDFLKASADASSIRDLAPNAPSLEGFLFPATYRLTHASTAEDLCHMMVAEFRRQWKKLDGADALKTVTLASMVEKETGYAEERKIVAGVFANRIARGMKLDCDPTTIYAALLDGRYNGVIHKSDLANKSPYNTYQNQGLPPGPIANPGLAALDAALHPAQTEFMFFVAKADGGGHVFSITSAEHQKAVLAYRHAKHKAG